MLNPGLQEWSELPRAKLCSRTVTFCPAKTERFWPQLAAVSNLLEEDGKTTKSINKLRKRSAQQDRLPKKDRTVNHCCHTAVSELAMCMRALCLLH